MSVAEAKGRIDSREFTDWMAYYASDPWADIREPIPEAERKAGLAHRVWTAFTGAIAFAEARKNK